MLSSKFSPSGEEFKAHTDSLIKKVCYYHGKPGTSYEVEYNVIGSGKKQATKGKEVDLVFFETLFSKTEFCIFRPANVVFGHRFKATVDKYKMLRLHMFWDSLGILVHKELPPPLDGSLRQKWSYEKREGSFVLTTINGLAYKPK